jgi:hypothetical protein
MLRANSAFALLFLLWPAGIAFGQPPPEQFDRILSRLDQLEHENQTLLEELRQLRAEISALRAPPTAESANEAASTEQKLEIQANRTEELEQSKVGSSQRMPVRLNGMVLFNAFMNSHQNGGSDYPTVASAPGPGRAGATLRQTIIGLEFQGPRTVWGGAVHASVFGDFFTGVTVRDQAFRLRTASVEIDWKTRSILAGLEKPIFNPREPSSLAQVGISPLTGAGNLWLWLPQVRL